VPNGAGAEYIIKNPEYPKTAANDSVDLYRKILKKLDQQASSQLLMAEGVLWAACRLAHLAHIVSISRRIIYVHFYELTLIILLSNFIAET
jgi:hypothetical protein